MKKLFKLAMLAVSAVVLSTAICSCGGDDDSNDPGSGSRTPVSTKIVLTYEENGTINTVADVYVKYTNENGVEVDEIAEGGKFSKTITISKYPFNIKAEAHYKLKDGATVDPEAAYKTDHTKRYSVTTEFSTGKPYYFADGKVGSSSFKGKDMEKFLSETRSVAKLSIDTDGIVK